MINWADWEILKQKNYDNNESVCNESMIDHNDITTIGACDIPQVQISTHLTLKYYPTLQFKMTMCSTCFFWGK